MQELPKIECSIILDGTTARRHLNQWKKFIRTTAVRLSTPNYNIGYQLLTEAEWVIMHPITDEIGDAIAPTPRIPRHPAELAGNANSAQVTIHGIKTKIADMALASVNLFKATLLESIGPDIASETEDFDSGHIDIPTWDIYNHVISNYGIKNADDIAYFRNSLNEWKPDQPFPANIARMRRTFAEVADLNMFISEIDKVAALVQATAHTPAISGIVVQYMSLHPALAAQTFAGLASYIGEQLPLATAQVRANSATAQKAADDATIAALQAELTASRAEASAARSVVIVPGGAKKKLKAPTAADKAKWTPGRLYCWAHGFVMHNGCDCTKLAAEKAPQWQKDAVNPGPLHSQYGSRILE